MEPTQSLRGFADRLAQLASSQGTSRALRQLRLTGLLTPPEREKRIREKKNVATASQHPRRVGIWEERQRDGDSCFVRSMDTQREWFHWANVGRIEPKTDKFRVVMIGESVARGFLFDPQFNPAITLRMILEAYLSSNEIEIVDLARSNLGLEFQELATSALLLQPDMVIMFCGNNWLSVSAHSVSSWIDAALSENGVAGLNQVIKECAEARAQAAVQSIAAFYRSCGVPLLWIVPEFNLGDWRDPVGNAPYLLGKNNVEWLACLDAGHKAIESKNLPTALQMGRNLVDLDGGVSAAGFYLLAESSRMMGDLAAERQYLEMARDVVSSWNISPRITFDIQQILRVEIVAQGHTLVDLPKVFSEYLEGQLPGRRLFIDYCHLSVEGMQVSMAAAASSILRVLKGIEIDWRKLIFQSAAPSAQVQGEAAFLAAVHNSHWWQAADLVRHYCREAVRQAPGIAPVMLEFVELQTRRAPTLLCSAAERIANTASPSLKHYLLHYNIQQLDRNLVDAITEALQGLGMTVRDKVEKLRLEEHNLRNGTTDLLDYYYLSSAAAGPEVMGLLRRRDESVEAREAGFYKAYWRESRFAFIAGAASPVQLLLTCRLPCLEHGIVRLELNGVGIAEISATQHWDTWNITVTGDIVRPGINDLEVQWPIPQFNPEEALDRVAGDLMERIFPELFCCFGEIHSFLASDAVTANLKHPNDQEQESRSVSASADLQPVLVRRRAGIPIPG